MTSGNEQTPPNGDRDLNQTRGEMMRSIISRASTSGNSIDNNALMDLLQAVTSVVTRQQDQIDRNLTNGQNEEHPKLRSGMGEFKKLSLPSFEGTTDPMIAEHWITKMEKVFTYMRCPEEEKVDYAIYMLKDRGWWQMQVRTLGEKAYKLSWEEFKKIFYKKYFPLTVHKQKEQEFQKLEQGDKTIAEYEEEFTYLSKFATHLLGKEEDRARRFEEGLRPDIRKTVSAFELPTYG
ncbi:uncharacterized protein LOC109846819 [Asparagus officinalis]|uniref:uncharacterized protein LOC109846819 n=1 Tax=Asparagus officinalis TaxID=4686 RepID=UPI00098E5523|nr:uncharacterized protein LOC109846819 [Asparagus officinalis]